MVGTLSSRGRMQNFRVIARESDSAARLGFLATQHGEIETPVFMPVGTAATVKSLPQDLLNELEVKILLCNTYHLYLRPGTETIAALGGLHRFMSWDASILTDSGGFQVFSQRQLRQIREDGVHFRSHLDGSSHLLTPEKAVEIQQVLGSDITMVLDDCTPYPSTYEMTRASLEMTARWAGRCRRAFRSSNQLQFGIVQGGMFSDLRIASLSKTVENNFDGYALGGFSVGEPKELMWQLVEDLEPHLPSEKPRYLMGVGSPLDLVEGALLGIDMFDCVMPTRNARNGCLFTSAGRIIIKNARYRNQELPLDANCNCKICRTYSRGYLRHLFVSGELLSSVLNTYHNLYFYLDIMRKIRHCIPLNSLSQLRNSLGQVYG